MAELTTRRSGGYIDRPASSSLVDVLNVILDKGLVIDAFVRVSLVGIEVITIDARIVIASVDTYLRFAEATNRLDLEKTGGRELPELVEDMSSSGSHGKTKGLLQGAKEALMGSDDKSEDEEQGKEQDQDDDKRKQPQERSRQRTTRSRRER